MNTSRYCPRSLFVIFAVCLFSFFVLAFALLHGSRLDLFDHEISQVFYRLRNPELNLFVMDFSALGAPAVTSTLSVISIVLLFLSRAKVAAIYLSIVMFGVTVWSPILKAFCQRERPDLDLRLLEVTGFSFPSGHALGSTCFFLGLCLISCCYFKRASARRITLALTVTLLLAIAATRIYLGAHYPSDVMGGMLFGTAWTTFVLFNLSFFEKKFRVHPAKC